MTAMDGEHDGRRHWWLVCCLCLAAAAVALIVAMAPAWLTIMRADPARPRDFVQDWASARNVLTGRPAYTDQRLTLPAYLGPATQGGANVIYNAHPPTSIIITLPFALLDFASAGWWWNAVSLALLTASLVTIAVGVGLRPRPLTVLVGVALLMVWVPLWLHTLQGQLGLLLLAVFTASWWAGRTGRWAWCGGAIGLAATIKVFPIVLLGLLVVLGRWRAVATGLAMVVVVSVLTAAVTGIQAFVDYATIVVPGLNRWRPDWINSSLTGYVAHFFAPDTSITPVFDSPILAAGLTAAASLVVVGVVARTAWRRGGADFDGVFGLALTGLLLLSALTWSHYFVVLLLPLLIWLHRLTTAGQGTAGRWFILATTWLLMALPQLDIARAVVGGDVADPWHAATVLALNFYGLLGFFIAQAWWLRSAPGPYVDADHLLTSQPELVMSGNTRR